MAGATLGGRPWKILKRRRIETERMKKDQPYHIGRADLYTQLPAKNLTIIFSTYPGDGGQQILRILLFLLAHTFVWLSVLVHIHKPSSVGVSFDPLLSFRIQHLRTFPDGTIAMSVTGLSILFHMILIL
jgi:hypothetical protein